METQESIINSNYAKFYVCDICNRKIHEDYMILPDAKNCDTCYKKNNIVDIVDDSQIYKNRNGAIIRDIDDGDIMCLLLAFCIFLQ